MKRVYISVINDLATDQRVQRVAGLLSDRGMEVVCIGRRLKSSPELDGSIFREDQNIEVKRYRMLFNKGPLFYAFFNQRLFFSLLFARRPSLFISNDLDTLPANYLVSSLRGVKLIYDSHEYFTQVPELINRKGVQSIWKWIEHRIVPRLQHAVTVSYPIATIYRRLHGTRFRVVRNIPVRRARPEDELLNRTNEKAQIIYQGALNVGRGLELMIETMAHLEDSVFTIAGTGNIEADLKKKVTDLDLSDRVIFTGRLSPGELYPLTCGADLGISLEEDLGLNYRYALPNKIFDYIQCRVPVLCSALPEMSRIVETYGIGVVVHDRKPERLAGTIRFMLKERASGAWREALDRAAEELCWENESKEYIALLEESGVL